MRILLSLALATSLAGCTSISIKTIAHSDPSANFKGKKITLIGITKETTNSLEFKAYKKLMEELLQANGLIPTDDGPDIVGVLAYDIDNGKSITRSMPIFGQTGGGSSTTYGNIGGQSFSANTYQAQRFGVVGTNVSSGTEYMRRLWVNIYDVDPAKSSALYELRSSSRGSCEVLPTIVPYLIKSAFSEFPLPSGKQRSESLSFKDDC